MSGRRGRARRGVRTENVVQEEDPNNPRVIYRALPRPGGAVWGAWAGLRRAGGAGPGALKFGGALKSRISTHRCLGHSVR